MVVTSQVSSVAVGVTTTVGAVMSSVITTVSVDTHPVAEFVTVKVYVPGASTVGLKVVESVIVPGPVHK